MPATEAIRDPDISDPASPQQAPAADSWSAFLEDMQNAPRDEYWDEFMRVIKERPMNQLPVERNLFRDSEQ